jgi:anthranilate synthase component 2
MSRTLIVDNYDSFTYNLVHLLRELGASVDVRRNDDISLRDVDPYDRIVLSPGPGIPSEVKILESLIRRYSNKIFLGVCLGHQAIGETFGATLTNMQTVYHGVATSVYVTEPNDVLFQKIPKSFRAGRYHSWAVSRLPQELIPTAVDDAGTIMALRHMTLPIFGVQFHPESILTPYGRQILQNWLEI